MADTAHDNPDPWDDDFEADSRQPRALDNRESLARAQTWAQPSVLPEPDRRPGWVHRWIRTSVLGNADNRNVSMRFREGFEPVKAKDYPEMMAISDVGGRFTEAGNIEIGGLVLCRIPEEVMKQREAHFQNLSQRQMESVDEHYLRENDARMPLLRPERRSRTTFGRGGESY